MNFTRTHKILSFVALVVLGLLIYGGYVWQTDIDTYQGLVLHDDTGLTAETQAYFENQLHTAQAALEVQLSSDNSDEELERDLYLAVAWNAAALGNLVLARETYEDYFQLNQINPAAWSSYGTILMRMEDYGAAEEAFRTQADLTPSEEAYRDLSKAINNTAPGGDRDQEIKAALEEGVSKVGQTPWFMTELAGWYLDHGDCEKAIDHFEVAKFLLPADNEAIVQDIEMARAQCSD